MVTPKKELKKTVGMAVRPEYRDKLLSFKPPNMTLTEFFEVMATWVFDKKDDFIPGMQDINNARMDATRVAKNQAAKARCEAEIEANNLMYSPTTIA